MERQANALQAIADVEWSQAAVNVTGSTGAYAAMHSSVKPFHTGTCEKRAMSSTTVW